MYVNIGGGTFKHEEWVNYDALTGFDLTPETRFPIESTPVVYSSHCLEHLPDATVHRVLKEARRMLAPGGIFVLKLPDFEKVLDRYRAGDDAFFKQWGMDKLAPSWPAQGVEDTIAARAAMIFCGVWEPAYGDKDAEFTKKIGAGYHGPVPMTDETYRTILAWPRINDIPRAFAACKPEGWHFNHQNAWSHEEIRWLLKAYGFRIMETAPVGWMPGIDGQRDISMYVYAQ